MTGIDILLGFLAGVLSVLTPQTLLLIPLMAASAGADGPSQVAAIVIGAGLSLVLIGAVPLGVDAIWIRKFVCLLLFLEGIILLRRSTVDRYSLLTGGSGSDFVVRSGANTRAIYRLILLAILVGANWVPAGGPTLFKASIIAAGSRDLIAPAVLMAFGIGGALPWIVLGRAVRFGLRPIRNRRTDGMGGKRALGLTLMFVAVLGGVGWDAEMVHSLNGILPPGMAKLATTY